MQATTNTQQPTNIKKRWPWSKNKNVGSQPTPQKVQPIAPAQEASFYEKAIEWTHRADKIINLVLGYLLAIASVLGFMDVLSNGQVLNQVPFMFYVWLGIMGLGVDFQILLVIGRIPDLFSMSVAGWQKWLIFLFNVAFLVFLAVMSVVISAVFTQHRDMPVTQIVDASHHLVSSRASTISDAMNTLGINGILFVYGRAALATLLLVLMAVDRTMERWRMQITATTQHVAMATYQQVTNMPVQPAAVPGLQVSDIDKLLQGIVAMNQQNIQAMQAMQQATIQQVSQVTVSLVEETVNRLSASISLPSGNGLQQIGQGNGQGIQEDDNTMNTGDIPAMGALAPSSQGIQKNANGSSYKDEIEALLRKEPGLTDREIADRIGCSQRTANRWKDRTQVHA
jgi:hypothetical protein